MDAFLPDFNKSVNRISNWALEICNWALEVISNFKKSLQSANSLVKRALSSSFKSALLD
jgi:hypothetical protein